jgi:histidinol-phosphate aminotransferase
MKNMGSLKMNGHIRAYTPKDYGYEAPESLVDLDCSLGVNQEDLPDSVFAKLKELGVENQDPVKQYPYGGIVPGKIADWYRRRGLDWLKPENTILGCGSFGLLCNINLLCLSGRKRVLGHAPQFPAYVDHVNYIGARYDTYVFPRAKKYQFEAEAYLEAMDRRYDLFIVENPNNPTGQEMRLDDIQAIAAKAGSLNTILVVDEAYGDYLELSRSAINLIPQHPNVVVVRTFSKGLGMAGVRLGYAFVSSENDILPNLKKLETPFNCNGVARFLAEAVIEGHEEILKIEEVRVNKQKVLSALTKLKAAETSERTPIMTIYYDTPSPRFSLQKFLAENAGLGTVNCAAYHGLDQRAVRLMLPKAEDVDKKLIPKLMEAQNRLA